MGQLSVLTKAGVIGSKSKAAVGSNTDAVVNAERLTYCLWLR